MRWRQWHVIENRKSNNWMPDDASVLSTNHSVEIIFPWSLFLAVATVAAEKNTSPPFRSWRSTHAHFHYFIGRSWCIHRRNGESCWWRVRAFAKTNKIQANMCSWCENEWEERFWWILIFARLGERITHARSRTRCFRRFYHIIRNSWCIRAIIFGTNVILNPQPQPNLIPRTKK